MSGSAVSSPLSAAATWLPQYRWIPIAGGLVAFAWSFMIGANDVAVSFGTSVGSGALTMLQAAIIAATMEITGAVLMGNRIIDTLQSDVIRDPPADKALLMWGLFIALIAATLWLAISTCWELPVSSTLSIWGAIIGVCLAAQGVHSIYWNKSDSWLHMGGVTGIILSWIIAPLIAGVASFLLFSFAKQALLRSLDSEIRTLRAMPVLYGVTVMIVIFSIIYRGSPREVSLQSIGSARASLVAGLSGIGASVLAYLIVVPLASKRLGCFAGSRKSEPKTSPERSTPESSTTDSVDSQGKDLKVDIPDDSTPPEKTADELIKEYTERHVLETVYEGDDEDESESSPKAVVKCSPACGPKISFGQLLKQTPNRLTAFRRIQRPRKLTPWGKVVRSFQRLKSSTIDNKIDYDQRTLIRHALAEKFDHRAEELFSFLQILTACAAAFLHGSNDVATALAPCAALFQLYQHHHELEAQLVPTWLLAFGGAGVSLGFAFWGWKLVRCLGGRITYMSPSRGFCAQLCAVTTGLLATKVHLPVSTTHILIGSIFGVGLADSRENVNWRLLPVFVLAWMVALLLTCGTAAGLYSFTVYSPSYSAH